MITIAVVGLICLTIILCTVLGNKSKCRHVWTKSEAHEIEVSRNGNKAKQEQCIMTCKFCGELIHLNLTTGERVVLSQGGTPVKEDKII